MKNSFQSLSKRIGMRKDPAPMIEESKFQKPKEQKLSYRLQQELALLKHQTVSKSKVSLGFQKLRDASRGVGLHNQIVEIQSEMTGSVSKAQLQANMKEKKQSEIDQVVAAAQQRQIEKPKEYEPQMKRNSSIPKPLSRNGSRQSRLGSAVSRGSVDGVQNLLLPPIRHAGGRNDFLGGNAQVVQTVEQMMQLKNTFGGAGNNSNRGNSRLSRRSSRSSMRGMSASRKRLNDSVDYSDQLPDINVMQGAHMQACLNLVNDCTTQIKTLKSLTTKQKKMDKRDRSTFLRMQRQLKRNMLRNEDETDDRMENRRLAKLMR